MRIWKRSPKDAILVGLSIGQSAVMAATALTWDTYPIGQKILSGVLLALLIAYNIIVVTHLFTHVPWFAGRRLNAIFSVLNSVNAGQSVQAYQLTHVRNHHRFSNDRRGRDGTTRDASSTYRKGRHGEHEPLLSYALGGALHSLWNRAREFAGVLRLWQIRDDDPLRALLPALPQRRTRELRQIRADRAAHSLSLIVFALLSWRWTLCCYLPAFAAGLVLVNIQNYYRHFGANPEDPTANSVSHYGRLYNALTFNDGYHQEHHLAPAAHWSELPEVNRRFRAGLDSRQRIVSPVPAVLGFLDRGRPQLHRSADDEMAS